MNERLTNKYISGYGFLTSKMDADDDEAEQFREELNDALEGGGCTEIWETLSESRESDRSRTVECNSE